MLVFGNQNYKPRKINFYLNLIHTGLAFFIVSSIPSGESMLTIGGKW